jgi:holo-[acyl-carrier protein] synthase
VIAGVGLDLVSISAFAEQLDVPGTRFVEGTFTAQEVATCHERSHTPARHLAARFAAKEAFLKAWSSARRGQPPQLTSVDMREIEVVPDALRRPAIRLHGQVEQATEALGLGAMHVSLSHDGDTAGAVVMIEWEASP